MADQCEATLEFPLGDTIRCTRDAGHDDIPDDADTKTEHKKALHKNGLSAWGGIAGF